MSVLVPSIQKSTTFFCNVPASIKNMILSIMPFEEGKLPVRYLGVPLISSRLLYKDCKVLIEKMEKRIMDWRNKYLSFAGGLQLIISILSSMYTYWSSVFILPSRIMADLEKTMRGFLWCQGDGRDTLAWYDNWSDIGPLANVIQPKDITRAGLSLQAKVADIFNDGEWTWPSDWLGSFPVLHNISSFVLQVQKKDELIWKDTNGEKAFSSSMVCDTIRSREQPVDWVKAVWNAVKGYASMQAVSNSWGDITNWMIVRSKSRSLSNVVGRLIVAATAYFIWHERNNRMFEV
uniref:uncharacterized protein LOC122601296 n=1 Tax=Erigeron canadensis TaxID=72917 RepID=UPI001CB8C6F6|nr:uncharacterized protein LOC122601296 [Erigeron canadensis]